MQAVCVCFFALLPARGGVVICSMQSPSQETPINHRLHCRIRLPKAWSNREQFAVVFPGACSMLQRKVSTSHRKKEACMVDCTIT